LAVGTGDWPKPCWLLNKEILLKQEIVVNKKIDFGILFILVAFGLSACGTTIVRGSGNVITENRDVSHFNSMAFSVRAI
jgi:predicted small secreted protein